MNDFARSLTTTLDQRTSAPVCLKVSTPGGTQLPSHSVTRIVASATANDPKRAAGPRKAMLQTRMRPGHVAALFREGPHAPFFGAVASLSFLWLALRRWRALGGFGGREVETALSAHSGADKHGGSGFTLSTLSPDVRVLLREQKTTLRCPDNIGRHMHLELLFASLPIPRPSQQPLFASIRVHSRFLLACLLTDVGKLNFGTANERE